MVHNASRNRGAVSRKGILPYIRTMRCTHRVCRNRFSKFSFQTTLLSLVLYDKILWYE